MQPVSVTVSLLAATLTNGFYIIVSSSLSTRSLHTDLPEIAIPSL